MAAAAYISDKTVVDLVPYKARGIASRLDVGPFALLYLAVFLCWQRSSDPKDGSGGQAAVLVLLPGVLACHLLLFLSTQWSIRIMCLVSQWRVASIDRAEVQQYGYVHRNEIASADSSEVSYIFTSKNNAVLYLPMKCWMTTTHNQGQISPCVSRVPLRECTSCSEVVLLRMHFM